jgi:hypothetical protein
LVAFGTIPAQKSGPGFENSPAGSIRCSKNHNRIYFPRDFRLYPSAVVIAEETMQENHAVYKVINPSWESSSNPPPTGPSKTESESSIEVGALNGTKVRPASLLPDPRRQIANKVAKDRWASWALKKVLQ